MERMVDLKDISDGRLYTAEDMVKLGCEDCKGCSVCCREMEKRIQLDPYDCVSLERALSTDFSGLAALDYVEFCVTDGLIFPYLKIDKKKGACPLLTDEGRCSIHGARPGFCRLFPLGRYYHDRIFSYILQTHQCAKEPRVKVKVKKWLGVPDIRRYERYSADWHYYWKDLEASLPKEDDEARKQAAMRLLQRFYLEPWGDREFYGEFYRRLEEERSGQK